MKLKHILPGFLVMLGMAACIEDTIQVENLSDEIRIEREIAIPLIKATFLFDDLAGEDYDSIIIADQDTIKLYVVEDIGFQDTISFGDTGENMDFEFINLHNRITNMFPVGLDLNIYLYDSVTSQNIDTIFFGSTPGELFIQPAPLDSDGLVIEDEVEETYRVVELGDDIFDNLFQHTSHLIIDATVPSTAGMVKVLKYYELQLKMGLEAKGSYIVEPENE
jgi:hypothetical protein